MLDTYVLGRNHLAVEHQLLGTVLLVVLLDEAEDALYEVFVVIVRRNLQTHELSSLYESVDADGQVLAADVDVAGVEQWQHTVLLQLLQVLVVGGLHFVAEIDDATQILQIVYLVVHSILDTAVQVDGEHGLGTRRNTTGTQRIAETVVGNLVAQTAARAQRVSIVAHIGEERVSFRIHLCREVAPLLVLAFTVLVNE